MERTINGKDYELKMTRKSIRRAEKEGMRLSELGDTPVGALYALWYAAIAGKQPMTVNKSDDLLDEYLDGEDCEEKASDLLAVLVEEYGSVLA